MQTKENRYGINMIEYINRHETRVRQQIDSADSAGCRAMLEEHWRKIGWLQHERLVHLLVTLLVAVFLMFLYGLLLLAAFNILILILLVGVAVLLAAYLYHYFRLENSVQRWYKLADELRDKAAGNP